MLDKQQVKLHFSRNAQSYDNYAVVQKKMATKLAKLLEANNKNPQAILEIGCGTGNYTQILAEKYPQAQILATDISAEMLAITKHKLAAYPNISYQLADGEKIELGGEFDLITSNAVFQWFTDYKATFKRYLELLELNGQLLYATFGERTFNELHNSFALAYKKLGLENTGVHGPKFVTTTQLQEFSNNSAWQTVFREEDQLQYFSTAKEFLQAVKKVGANNASTSEKLLVSRRLLLQMLNEYQTTYQKANQVRATYHIIYGLHQKRQ